MSDRNRRQRALSGRGLTVSTRFESNGSRCARVESLESRTLLSATLANLGTLAGQSIVTDSVDLHEVTDSYRFSMATSGTFDARLTGGAGHLDIRLFSAFQATPTSPPTPSSALGPAGTHISENLAGGTYFIKVRRTEGGDQVRHYGLRLTSDYAGTIPRARNVGVIPGRVEFDDYVGLSPADVVDYYRIVCPRPGTVTAILSGLTSNADLELIRDRNGNGVVDETDILAKSTLPGLSPDSIVNHATGAGVFFIRVNRMDGNTNYHLRLGADQAGNTPATARNIGNLVGRQSFVDLVSKADTIDIYRFTLPSAGRIDASVNTTGAAIVLKDSNQNQVAFGTPSSLSVPVAQPGTYYLEVQRAIGGGDTTYQLNLTSDFAGSTPVAARDFGVLLGRETSADFVGATDSSDFNKFTLAANGRFSATLDGLTANATVRLIRDTNRNRIVEPALGEVLLTRTSTGNAPITISDFALDALQVAGPFQYYLEVQPATGANTNYNLQMFADYAGQSTALARSLGNLGAAGGASSASATDFIGANDASDVYRVDLLTFSNLDVVLHPASTALHFSFLREDGAMVNQANSFGTAPQFLHATSLVAGRYFVVVNNQAAGAGTSTNYDLNLATTPITDEAGNTRGAAHLFGFVTPEVEPFPGYVGSDDADDFYRFNLAPFHKLKVILDGMTANANVQVLDANGNIKATSSATGTSEDIIELPNVSGDLFVRVFPAAAGQNTRYKLTIRGDAGDTQADAVNAGALGSVPNTFANVIDGVTDRDVFKFTASGLKTINVRLTTANSLIVEILDGFFHPIASASTQQAFTGTTTIVLTKSAGLGGTFYARVSPGNNEFGTYGLGLFQS